MRASAATGLRVIASIEEPQVIGRMLEHLARDRQSLDPAHPSRAPPHARLSIRSNAIRAKQALARAGSASPRAVRQSRRRFLPRRGDSQGRSNAVGWQ